MLKLIPIFVMLLIITPFVNSEILDEKTELNCISNNINKNCVWEQSQGKRFHNDDGEWKTHLSFLEYGIVKQNYNIEYKYDDGTEIIFIPVAVFNDDIVLVNDLLSQFDLEYFTEINNTQFESKYEIRFKKHKDLDYIGFQVLTNSPIEYIDYVYSRGGVYEFRDNEEIIVPEINTTDLIINNQRISFIDLFESGFNYYYNKTENVLWIDIRNENGQVTLDPTSTFFSNSNDGYWTYEENIPITCLSATSTGTTAIIQDNHISIPAIFEEGVVSYNTASLPDDAIISSVTNRLYAHSYLKKGRGLPTWTVLYQSKKVDLGTLTCSDNSGITTAEGTLNWGGTVGFKTKSILTTSIDKTSYTTIKETPNWLHLGSGQQMKVLFRTSEYTGTSSDPLLTVIYTVPITNLPPIVNLTIPFDNSNLTEGVIKFSCNATDDIGLSNISLFGNFNGTYLFSQTKNITGTFNESTFFVPLINNTYLWNCEAYDNESLSDYADSNFTLNVFPLSLIKQFSVKECPSGSLSILYIMMIILAICLSFIFIMAKINLGVLLSGLLVIILSWYVFACAVVFGLIFVLIGIMIILYSFTIRK